MCAISTHLWLLCVSLCVRGDRAQTQNAALPAARLKHRLQSPQAGDALDFLYTSPADAGSSIVQSW